MRNARWLAMFVVVAVVSVAAADPGEGGASVEHGEDTGWWQWHFDGDNLVTINGTSPDLNCSEDDLYFWKYQEILMPSGVLNYHDHGFYFMRAYATTPQELFAGCADFDCLVAAACAADPIAEGIVQATYRSRGVDPDTGAFVQTYGVISQGHHYAGALYDLAGQCDNGMVNVEINRFAKVRPNDVWPDCAPGCVVNNNWGPVLSCED